MNEDERGGRWRADRSAWTEEIRAYQMYLLTERKMGARTVEHPHSGTTLLLQDTEAHSVEPG